MSLDRSAIISQRTAPVTWGSAPGCSPDVGRGSGAPQYGDDRVPEGIGRRAGGVHRVRSRYSPGLRHVALANHAPSPRHARWRSNARLHERRQHPDNDRARTRMDRLQDAGIFSANAGRVQVLSTALRCRVEKPSVGALGVTNPSNVQKMALLATDGSDLMTNGRLDNQGQTTLVAGQTLPRPVFTAKKANPLCLGGWANETARS
jgi:hypothetical protein